MQIGLKKIKTIMSIKKTSLNPNDWDCNFNIPYVDKFFI